MILIEPKIIDVKLPEYKPGSLNLFIKDDSTIYINDSFPNFKPEKLKLVVEKIPHEFNVYLIYSFDKLNWSNGYLLEINVELENDIIDEINNIIQARDLNYFPELFIGFRLEKAEINYVPNDIKFKENQPDTDIPNILITSIEYENHRMFDIESVKIISDKNLTNRYPAWNLYDNQQPIINHWLNQVDSIMTTYGHTTIYYKTRPVTISESLQVIDNREIVSIKKVMVGFPNNDLPKDTVTYTDWDYMMADENICQVSRNWFERIFGKNTFPEIGDIIFIPIVNKLFRVTSVSPKNGYMGVIGWWEVYLGKYSDDETISMSDEIERALEIESEDYPELSDIIESTEKYVEDTLITPENKKEYTIEEVKSATENFTNKFTDSTHYVDVKETEIIRSKYNKRLSIVSVNPDTSSFPINMYNCKDVSKSEISLIYDLVDNTSINKHSLNLKDTSEIVFSFNFVLLGRNTSIIYDLTINNNIQLIEISTIKNKLKITIFGIETISHVFDCELKYNEYYQINFNIKQKQIHLSVSTLIDKYKKLFYQYLYIVNNEIFSTKDKFTHLNLFGGNYLIGETHLLFDNKNILSDYINPVLIMNNN